MAVRPSNVSCLYLLYRHRYTTTLHKNQRKSKPIADLCTWEAIALAKYLSYCAHEAASIEAEKAKTASVELLEKVTLPSAKAARSALDALTKIKDITENEKVCRLSVSYPNRSAKAQLAKDDLKGMVDGLDQVKKDFAKAQEEGKKIEKEHEKPWAAAKTDASQAILRAEKAFQVLVDDAVRKAAAAKANADSIQRDAEDANTEAKTIAEQARTTKVRAAAHTHLPHPIVSSLPYPSHCPHPPATTA